MNKITDRIFWDKDDEARVWEVEEVAGPLVEMSSLLLELGNPVNRGNAVELKDEFANLVGISVVADWLKGAAAVNLLFNAASIFLKDEIMDAAFFITSTGENLTIVISHKMGKLDICFSDHFAPPCLNRLVNKGRKEARYGEVEEAAGPLVAIIKTRTK